MKAALFVMILTTLALGIPRPVQAQEGCFPIPRRLPNLTYRLVDIRGVDPSIASTTPEELKEMSATFEKMIGTAPGDFLDFLKTKDCSPFDVNSYEDEKSRRTIVITQPDMPSVLLVYVFEGPRKLKATMVMVPPNDIQTTVIGYFVWGDDALSVARSIKPTRHLKKLFPELAKGPKSSIAPIARQAR